MYMYIHIDLAFFTRNGFIFYVDYVNIHKDYQYNIFILSYIIGEVL